MRKKDTYDGIQFTQHLVNILYGLNSLTVQTKELQQAREHLERQIANSLQSLTVIKDN